MHDRVVRKAVVASLITKYGLTVVQKASAFTKPHVGV
jgi:hypothetical protein